MSCVTILVVFLLTLGPYPCARLWASEVLPETDTTVVIREHPKTGRPYVSIVSKDAPPSENPLPGGGGFARPDYRLLDPGVKTGDVSYDGPVSDRKKVYIFAATIAASGVGAGALGLAGATSTAGAGSGSGAGLYLAGGAAALAGAGEMARKAMNPSDADASTRTSEVHLVYTREPKRVNRRATLNAVPATLIRHSPHGKINMALPQTTPVGAAEESHFVAALSVDSKEEPL